MDFTSSQDSEEDEKDFEVADLQTEAEAHQLHKGEFFGCYLLVSKNPKFKGRTYIGFTVDPNRRIRQHNAGSQMGGARKTSGRGPWEMVLIVHGFPNDIAALRFEWAWQHPNRSRRLGKEVARRKSKESPFMYRFRVLAEMLSVGPWCRLPLTIRWLKQEYEVPFPLHRQPPVHMPLAYGLVDIKKDSKKMSARRDETSEGEEEEGENCDGASQGGGRCGGDTQPIGLLCCLCCKGSENTATNQALIMLHCYHKACTMAAHATCLAPRFCGVGEKHILPVSGCCPVCSRELLWGELVRRYKARERRKKEEESLDSQDIGSSQLPSRRNRRKPVTARETEANHWTAALRI